MFRKQPGDKIVDLDFIFVKNSYMFKNKLEIKIWIM